MLMKLTHADSRAAPGVLLSPGMVTLLIGCAAAACADSGAHGRLWQAALSLCSVCRMSRVLHLSEPWQE